MALAFLLSTTHAAVRVSLAGNHQDANEIADPSLKPGAGIPEFVHCEDDPNGIPACASEVTGRRPAQLLWLLLFRCCTLMVLRVYVK